MEWVRLFLTVLIINVIPAFAPPTWLAVAHAILEGMDPLQAILISMIAAAIGRSILYTYSSFFYRFLPPDKKKDFSVLKKKVEEKKDDVVALSTFYALTPFPTNLLFIFSGLARVPLLPVLIGFLIGRSVTYSAAALFYAKSAEIVESVFRIDHFMIESLTLIVALALIFVDWDQVLKNDNRR